MLIGHISEVTQYSLLYENHMHRYCVYVTKHLITNMCISIKLNSKIIS